MSMTHTTLETVVDFMNGGAWNQSEYTDTGIPVVRVSDIHDETVQLDDCKYVAPSSLEKYRKHLLQTGDVVVATVGSHPTQPGSVVGRAAKVPVDANGTLLNQNAVRLRPLKGGIDPTYLRYLAVSQYFRNYIIAHARGSANQVRMAISLLKEMPICLPGIERQREIGDILSAYDDLIENNTQRIKILEQMAQMLYREWFVNFRFPGHEKVSMVESELGLIPEGWKAGSLSDALVLQRGFDLPASQRVEGQIPIYASTGRTGTHNIAKAKAPGIVTGRSGSLGSVNLILEDFWPLNTTLWVKEFRRSSAYHAYFLLQDMKLGGFNSGSAVPTLNRNDIHGLPTVLPSVDILAEFDSRMSLLFRMRKVLQRKNEILRTTRDLLLPKLVSGEINVEIIEEKAVAEMV